MALNSIEEEARRAAMIRSGRIEPLPKPKKTRIIAFANQKGGVGKTTSCVNIALALTLYGQRVLVLDADPQGNASTALDIEHHGEGIPSTYEAIMGLKDPIETIYPHAKNKNLFCMPATMDLCGADIELTSVMNRERSLRRVLANPAIREMKFDYILIDCPPSLGLLTVNALAAAQELVIPIQCEFYALEGVAQLTKNVGAIRESLNSTLQITGILLTMLHHNTNLSKDVEAEVRNYFGDTTFTTRIPRNVRVAEAPSYGQTVLEYDPGSPGSAAYLAVAKELVEREPEEIIDWGELPQAAW
ncbi:MAG: ParA family protein [Bifidobacterium sp.]|nr:ParA family protein [Bifidobacterium sp.]